MFWKLIITGKIEFEFQIVIISQNNKTLKVRFSSEKFQTVYDLGNYE